MNKTRCIVLFHMTVLILEHTTTSLQCVCVCMCALCLPVSLNKVTHMLCTNAAGLPPAWTCCYRAREPRWSPWSQTWVSARPPWSSSQSTAFLWKSKELHRNFWSLNDKWFSCYIWWILSPPMPLCFIPPVLPREYDNLKGGLKSSNDMCEKLRREVVTSNNKVLWFNKLVIKIKCASVSRVLHMLSPFDCCHFSYRKQWRRWIGPKMIWGPCRTTWPMRTKRSL